MRFKTVLAIMLACAAAGVAQEHMADTLRNGILEEDSKQRPAIAIQQYQAVLTQYAEARQTAATALFRMAECYRKQGNRNAAVVAYQRLVKEFGDQPKLAAQSRTVLTTTYNVSPAASGDPRDQNDKANFDKLMETQKQQQAKTDAARARYRATIEDEMALDDKQLSFYKKQSELRGIPAEDNPAITDLEEKIIRLKRDLAAFDAGMATPSIR